MRKLPLRQKLIAILTGLVLLVACGAAPPRPSPTAAAPAVIISKATTENGAPNPSIKPRVPDNAPSCVLPPGEFPLGINDGGQIGPGRAGCQCKCDSFAIHNRSIAGPPVPPG